MKDPKEFPVMDDDPRNNGWGYNSPNPYDNYPEQEDEDETQQEDVEDEQQNDWLW